MNLSRLPDELILECFARLPNKSRYTASLVCRKWLKLLESREFYLLRKQLGHINHLTCLLQHHPTPTRFSRMSMSERFDMRYSSSSSNPPPCSGVINVFDPVSGFCKTLPPLPNPSIYFDDDCKIVSSEGKLILMKVPSRFNRQLGNPLFVFDFATGRWRQGKSMPTRKTNFAMAASDDCRVFVAGGFHVERIYSDTQYAWMYDVRKDEWSELPRFQHGYGIYSTGAIIGNKFIVTTLCSSMLSLNLEVYNIESRKWKRAPIRVSPSRLPWRRYEYFFPKEKYKRVFNLPLGDSWLRIYYRTGREEEEIEFMTLQDNGKNVKIEVPRQIYGNVYSLCPIEVH